MVGSVSTRKKDFNNCLLEVLAIINFFVYFCPSFVVKRGMDFFFIFFYLKFGFLKK